jgi:hypothetical protein
MTSSGARPGEIPDALAPCNQTSQRAKQRHLIRRISAVSVRQPDRVDDVVTALPGPKAGGFEAGQLGHSLNLIGPF